MRGSSSGLPPDGAGLLRRGRPGFPLAPGGATLSASPDRLGADRERSPMRPLAWCSRLLPFLLFLTLVAAPQAEAQTARELAQSVFPSVVSLVMSSGLQSTRSGGFFIVREDVVATNAHVIQGATRGFVKFIGQEAQHEIVGVVGIDIQHDLALVKISHMKARPLPLGDPAQVAVGEQIYAVGSPEGLEGTFSPGLVSGIRPGETGTLYQIS